MKILKLSTKYSRWKDCLLFIAALELSFILCVASIALRWAESVRAIPHVLLFALLAYDFYRAFAIAERSRL